MATTPTSPSADAKKPPMTLRRQARRLLVLLAVAYGAIFFGALLGCDRILFQPHPSSYVDGPRILKLESGPEKISAVYYPCPGAKYTILLSHGNAEDMGDNFAFLEQLSQAGYNVFSYDYRGYGTSGGAPSEENTYADIAAAYRYVTGTLHTPPSHVILYGRSVGGGPSVELATREPVGGLILQSTFISAFRTTWVGYLVPGDRYRSLEKMERVHCPVLVMHGLKDTIISPRHGRALFAAANEPKQCLWVEGVGHNDFIWIDDERFAAALRRFVALVEENNRGATTRP